MFKLKNTVAALAAAAFAVLGATACEPVEGEPVPSTTTGIDAPGPWIAPTTTTVAPKPTLDPYSSNGMWTVPGDIGYGTYRAYPTGYLGSGYYELCRDVACSIGAGMIDNNFFDGPVFVEITTDVAFIELDDVRLEPVG